MLRFPARRSMLDVLVCVLGFSLTPGFAQDPIARLPAHAAVPLGKRVTVIDGGERPVVSSDLLVCPTGGLPDAVRRRLELGDVDAWIGDPELRTALAKLSVRYVTDAEGEAQIEIAERSFVVALHRGHASAARIEFDGPDETDIKVGPRDGIEVVVRDARDRPVAGIPVWLAPSGSTPVPGRDHLRTDSLGRARLIMSAAHARVVDLELCVGLIDADPPHTLLTAEQRRGRSPVVVALPDFGQVRLVARDSAGQPIRALAYAALTPAQATGRVGGTQFGAFGGAPPTSVDGGTLTFAHVALDLQLDATFVLRDEPEAFTVHGAGPTHQGEMVVLAKDDIELAPILDLRVLDRDGLVLGNAELGVTLACRGREVRASKKTDADGRLTVRVENSIREGEEPVLTITRRGRGATTTNLGGVSVSLDRDRLHGTLELGDLCLAEEPVILRGTLLDVDGRPLPSVRLVIDAGFASGRGSHSVSTDGRGLDFVHAPITDADGRFEILQCGPTLEDFSIYVDAKDYLRVDDKRATRGDLDFRLVVVRSGTLAGRLEPAPTNASSLRVDLRGATWHKVIAPSSDGSFRFDAVMPGTCAVVLTDIASPDHPLARIEAVEVRSGGPTIDARLTPLRWEDLGGLATLTILDGKQRPVVGARVLRLFRAEDGGISQLEVATSGSTPLEMRLRAEGSTFRIEHPEYCDELIAGMKADHTAQLKPRARIALELRGLPQLPDGVRIDCAVVVGAASGYARLEVLGVLGGSATTLTIRPPENGHLRILLIPVSAGSSLTIPRDAVDVAVEVEVASDVTERVSLDTDARDALAQQIERVRGG